MATLTNTKIADTYKLLLKAGSTSVALASGSGSSERLVFGEDDNADNRTAIYVTQDRVGIGTASPVAPLNVQTAINTTSFDGDDADILAKFTNTQDTANGGGAYICIAAARTGENMGIVWNSQDDDGSKFQLWDNRGGTGYARVSIDNDGKVGIGTTTPSSLLHLKSDATNQPSLFIENVDTDANEGGNLTFLVKDTDTAASPVDNQILGDITFKGYNTYSGADEYQIAAMIRARMNGVGAESATDMPGELAFYTTPNSSSTITQRMCILANGNVGIGADSPVKLLHVEGDTNAFADDDINTNAAMILANDQSADGEGVGLAFYLHDTAPKDKGCAIIAKRNSSENSELHFVTSLAQTPSSKMVIQPDGDVGIGLTSPNARFHVKDTAASWFVSYLHNEGNSASAYGLGIRCGTNGASAGAAGDAQPLIFYDGSGDGLGKVEAGTTGAPAFVVPSDRKLKKDIIDTKVDGLGVINGLKMRQFGWKKYPDAVTKIGFIAQECQDVYPEMVTTGIPSADGTDDGLDTLAVSDSVLVPVLVKAVQELSAKVTALENA